MRPDPGKLARAAVLAAGMAALAVGALASGSPSVSGLSAYVVTPGSALGIDGQGFTQFGTSDCTVGQAPSVTFYHLPDLAQTQVAPKSLNAPDCTDTHINLTVPGNLADGAQVGVAAFDNIGSSHQTGHNLQVTILPTISGISPASGQLGTNSVTVSGANLRPPTMPQNPQLTLACGTLGSWTGSSVSFNPDNQSCNQSLRFNVLKDASSQASTQQISLAAGAYTFLPPTVNGGNLGSATVGKTIAIAGQYLGPSAGQVTFGGGVTNPAISWSSNLIQVRVPPGAQPGALSVTVPGYGAPHYPNGNPSLNIDPSATSFGPSNGSAGTQVALNGFNFGATAGEVTVGGTTQRTTTWSDRYVVFSIGTDTDSGPIALNRADGDSAGIGNLTVVPKLTGLETNNVRPGAVVVVDGVSLGSGTGTVMIGGQRITPELWSRNSVLFSVPAVAPGTYRVSVLNAAGSGSNALSMVVLAPAPSPAASSLSGPRPSPVFDLNHQFVKPPKAASPVDLTIDAEPKKTAAGGTADLTVTLKLNGKPVPGSQIKLSMVFSPGTDYVFTPESGVTDATGTFKATVRISKTPGNNIVLAQSGIFSDQDEVTGTGSASGGTPGAGGSGGGSASNPAALGPIVPLIGLGALAGILVAAGLYINLRSHRGA